MSGPCGRRILTLVILTKILCIAYSLELEFNTFLSNNDS